MNNSLLKAYSYVPPVAQSWAATLRGWQLRRWRYGPETDQLVEQALARERWSESRWSGFRQDSLARLLDHAARHVPYYRDLWGARRRAGDRRPWDVLVNWPILEKETLRRDARVFVAEDCAFSSLFCDHTSGTTGTPLEIWRSRAGVRARYALFEARYRRWNGFTRHDRWAILGGQLVTPASRRRPPFWVWNAALRQLYLSSQHLAPGRAEVYFEAMKRYGVRYLWGYVSSLCVLAHEVLDRGLAGSGLEMVITNAEPLSDAQRKTIQAAFGCPVRETYGMVEFVAAAGECEHGALHAWPEVGELEVLVDESPAGPGSIGEFICTGFQNPEMPLIRYRVGDSGQTPTWQHACGCGRRLPVLRSLRGRSQDVVIAPDGRLVFWLNPVFYGQPVREAQIIQQSLDRIQVRYVPENGFDSLAQRTIHHRLIERLGPIQVDFEAAEWIRRGPNGKFQAVVSQLDDRKSLCANVE
jgi:phenylacetate-CoA ligase